MNCQLFKSVRIAGASAVGVANSSSIASWGLRILLRRNQCRPGLGASAVIRSDRAFLMASLEGGLVLLFSGRLCWVSHACQHDSEPKGVKRMPNWGFEELVVGR